MAKAKRKSSKASKLKKTWLSVLAPKIFNSQSIGEIYVGDKNAAIGKTIPVNLMNLTGNMKKQNINITFTITSIADNKANTQATGYKMVVSSLKRIVRRGKNKVDTIVTAETSDSKKVKMKIILVTRNATYASVRTSLRKSTSENLKRMIKKINYEEFLRKLTMGKLQFDLKKLLNKIYPIKICDVKQMDLVLESDNEEVKAEDNKEEAKEETNEVKPKETEDKKEKEVKKEKVEAKEEKAEAEK